MENQCPGHSGKCKFCKKEKSYPRFIAGMKQIDRKTGKPIVDFCCYHCRKNDEYAKKKFGDYQSHILGKRIPRGDEV